MGVKQNPVYHPEGDALYHSLQVFELARQQVPWDEEFLLAALLHDVGKAIDPADHVAAGDRGIGGFDYAAHGVSDCASHGRAGVSARDAGAPCEDSAAGIGGF
jgi:HD superfamily phosphodiesterase